MTGLVGLTSGWGRFGGVAVAPMRLATLQRIARNTRTAAEMIRVAREVGVVARRQSMLEIRREVLGVQRQAPALRGLRDVFKPSQALITTTKVVRSKIYEYRVSVQVWSAETGELTQYARFYDDELLTGGAIKNHGIDIVKSGHKRVYIIRGAAITMVSAYDV